jgi:hypothetical protein
LIGEVGLYVVDTIGFYNSTVFCIWKIDGDCLPMKNGYNFLGPVGDPGWEYNVTTLNHNSNSIMYEILAPIGDVGNEGILSKIRYEYIEDGPNSIKLIQHWSFVPDSGFGTSEVECFYTKSTTETNLSCN